MNCELCGFARSPGNGPCESCGAVPRNPVPVQPTRQNDDLDDLFADLQGTPRPVRPEIPPATIEKIGKHATRAAGAVAAVGAAAGGAVADATGGSAAPPDAAVGGAGGMSIGKVELGDDTIGRLSAAIAAALGHGAGKSVEQATTNAASGYEHRWNSEAAQWQKVPAGSTRREEDGEATKVGSGLGGRVGKWAGRAVGTALGARFGGAAGAKVGGEMGERAGEKAGESIGGGITAPIDRAVSILRSGDANNTMQRMAPGPAQPIIEWYKALDAATERMINHNRQLGEWSAAMGNVMAQRQAQEAFRSKEIGDRLEPSAQYLSDAEQSRKDGMQDITVLSQKVDNYIQGAMNKLGGSLVKPLNDIAKWCNNNQDLSDKAMTPWEYMQGMAAEGDKQSGSNEAKRAALAEEMRRSSRR